MLNVTFHGVRAGPGAGPGRYGAGTWCVALEVPGEPPLLLDVGSGAARFAASADPGVPVYALLGGPDPARRAGLAALAHLDLRTLAGPGRHAAGGAEVVVEAGDAAGGGCRVAWGGATVAYLPASAAAAAGADLAVQASAATAPAPGPAPALRLAAAGGVPLVALTGHHPSWDDVALDHLAAAAAREARTLGVDEVVVAGEGLTICFDPRSRR